MVTASMMPLTRPGSLILATPPSLRMSAGTRSSAITATAPASSAILAWSGVTTSMMTPPLSISASPALTFQVPRRSVAAVSVTNSFYRPTLTIQTMQAGGTEPVSGKILPLPPLPGSPAARPRRGRPILGWFLTAVLGMTAVLGVATAVGLAVTPSVDDLQSRVDVLLAQHGAKRVSIAQVPDRLSEALISIEDERFYQHHGIDLQGMARALFADLYHRRALEGGSTPVRRPGADGPRWLHHAGTSRGRVLRTHRLPLQVAQAPAARANALKRR